MQVIIILNIGQFLYINIYNKLNSARYFNCRNVTQDCRIFWENV